MDTTTSHRWTVVRRTVCLAFAAVTLAGCIVAPYPYHPYYPRYSYYR